MPGTVRPDIQFWNKLKPEVRKFRSSPTSAEDVLWQALRRRQLDGLYFRRQHPIANYVADFYCASARLVIELDGPIHDMQRDRDANRQTVLESFNLTVIRFTNEEVLTRLEEVLEKIRSVISLSPNPSPKLGEGESRRNAASASTDHDSQTPSGTANQATD